MEKDAHQPSTAIIDTKNENETRNKGDELK